MRNTIFRGVATALITPMTAEGIDYRAFEGVINWQVENGINALVIAGTTGEGSTLSDEEHRAAVKFAVETVGKRVPVIAATGSNDTDYAIDLTRYCNQVGSDGVLVVTPYYNKATQKGLVKMYESIAEASSTPVILYNVPSRTGIGIEPETYVLLAEHPNICGIKEANGDIGKIMETFALVGDKLDVYSGNDDQIVPLLAMGGSGVISVLSNIMPKETMEICDSFWRGDVAASANLQCKLLPLIKSLFSEVNPIPVKAAMAAMGHCEDYLRMPLTPMEDEKREVLFQRMRQQGLI